MSIIIKESYDKPFLYSRNNIVHEVNEEFINLVGYPENEIIGRSLEEIGRLLRIDLQINLQNVIDESNLHIFNKSLNPIEVSIKSSILDTPNDKILYFTEHPHDNCVRMLELARRLATNKKTGVACRRCPDLVLLEADQNFIDMLEKPYNTRDNCLGIYNNLLYEDYKFSEVYSTILRTSEPYYFEEVEFIHKDKGVVYYNASIVPIFIQGELRYLVQSILDVTEMVLNRKELELKNNELEAIFENLSDEVFIIGKNGEYIKMNKAARKGHLYDLKESTEVIDSLNQAKFYDISGDLLIYENLPFKRVLRGERLSDYRFVMDSSKGISYRELNGTPIYDSNGNFNTGVLICRDITEKLKNEESLLLKSQYTLLSRMIEELELGLVRLSYPDLSIIDLNHKAFKEIKQVNPNVTTQSSIIGENILKLSLLDKEFKVDEILDFILKTKEKSLKYIQKFIMSSEEKYLRIIMQPLYGLNNEIVEITLISIDNTDVIKAKNKMEETLKLQDDLFVNMSHELKTPLNVIFSASQLMDLYIDNNSIEAFKEMILSNNNIIKQNCYRLIKLINNIVDYSKIESGFLKLNLSNRDIVGTVENIVESVYAYTKKKELSIVFDTETEEQIIAFDAEKIERVILNIISNAVKFSNPGNKIYINVTDKNEFIHISIKDNGIGIEEKYLGAIFERFQQVDKSLNRNAEGSGIGLSLVKSIVDMHGGRISVKSEVGKGSIFNIELPNRKLEYPLEATQDRSVSRKVEMINIEFSDIYSI